MTKKRKRHLKGEFAPFQTSSILFNFILVCKILAKSSGIESERTVSEFRKRKENSCAVFTNPYKRAREIRKFQVSDLQRRLTNVQKSVMHVQSRCFADINRLLFLPISLPSPSLLLKLPTVVIKKCCYHGNVTSHFSSLYDRPGECIPE